MHKIYAWKWCKCVWYFHFIVNCVTSSDKDVFNSGRPVPNPGRSFVYQTILNSKLNSIYTEKMKHEIGSQSSR